MASKIIIALLIFPAFFLISCEDAKNGKKLDTPTSGEITIAADESLKPIIEAEEDVFESQYIHANVNIIYTSESNAIKLLLNDSARMAIVTRELYPHEMAELERQKIHKVRYVKIAYDAIGFILNNKNPLKIFSIEQLTKIISGQNTDWNEIDKKSELGKITVVFDNPSSGAIRHIKDSLLQGKPLGNNCFALNSNPEVIDYVEKNKGAIGIIGVGWISDDDDTLVRDFLSRVKVAEVEPIGPVKVESITNKPIQGNIALKQYPLWREVKIVSREARAGLGTGFASFVAGDQGQRIILKGGLVPARVPLRIVNINDKPIN